MNHAVFSLIWVFLIMFMGQAIKAELSYVTIREKGMGEAGVASSFTNPSGISFCESGFAFANYGNRFSIQELADINAGIILPNKLVDTGCVFSRFGYDHYNENRVSLIVSKRLAKSISLGFSCNYYFIQVAETEKQNNYLNSNIGIQWQLLPNCRVGMAVSNFLIHASTTEDDHIPVRIQVGISYSISEYFLVNSEWEKRKNDSIYKIGLEYQPVKQLFFRTGFLSSPFMPTFGIGYKLNHLDFDLAILNHASLGVSFAVGLTYNFKSE